MFRKMKRIKPVDEANSYILSLCDKPGFVERIIDKNKGTGQHITHTFQFYAFFSTICLHTLI